MPTAALPITWQGCSCLVLEYLKHGLGVGCLMHFPLQYGGALLLQGHGNYSTDVSHGLWVPTPCVCLISFRQ